MKNKNIMKHYRIITLLFLLLFGSGALYHNVLSPQPEKAQTNNAVCALALDAVDQCVPKDTPRHFEVYQRDDTGQPRLAGYAVSSSDLAPDVTGYAGPIPLVIGLNPQGIILNIHVGQHNETPGYIDNLPTFIKQFVGQKSDGGFVLGQDIDAITRATVTSQAVAETVRQTLAPMRTVLGQANTTANHARHLAWDEIVIPLLLFGFALASLLTRNILLRRIALAGGLLYFGLYKGSMFSILQVINLGLGHIPAFTNALLWFVLGGAVLGTLLVFGNLYCGYLCPFATLQEMLFALARRLKIPEIKVSLTLSLRARILKYVVLFALVAVSFILGSSDTAQIEVYLLLFGLHLTGLAGALVGFMLVMACVHYRFWCKYFCPVGALNGLIARASFLKITSNEKCAHCAACAKSCPTQALTIDKRGIKINPSECIVCGHCLRACHDKTLTFGRSE